ncbi:YfhO family protein [Levilactobacillus angrenensis]|uniref:YfhO family protein n=1 Tax=Levilactobacillus angrenensis TaxID=2486020 RepID=A0ABW1UAL3_9LACO|nr:YfhO family protein [Levilactobacillus angrenensis]
MKQQRHTLTALRVSRWVYGGAFLIPFAILCVIFWQLKITPFGPRNLLFSDMGTQYVPILENLRSTLLHGQFHLFSFSLGSGSGIIPLLAYYVISPFNLLIFAFSATKLPIAVTWIIILKISTIGLTMAFFIRHTFLRSGWSMLLFTTAFSLSGFVSMYFYDMMWLDALIWLPLVALGLHRLVSLHHYGLYTVSLTATIICNYYMGYMTCLFSVMYFIYLIIEHQPTPTPFKDVWHMHWPAIRQFTLGSLLAGGMSMVVLIPTAQGMLLTGKSNFFLNNYLPTPMFGPEVLAQFAPGTSSYVSHLYHAPSLFMGTLMFLLLIVFFVSPQVKAVEKNRTMWLLIVMGLGLFVTLLNTAWHMFQQPAGFPYRNVYFFTFLALVTAYRAWQTHPAQSMNDPQKVLALVWGAGLLVIGFLSAQVIPVVWDHLLPNYNHDLYVLSQPAFHLVWPALGLLLLNTMLLFISEWRPVRIGLLALLLFTELGGNFLLATRSMEFGSQPKFEKYFRRDTKTLAKISAAKAKPNLHRVDFAHAEIGKSYQGAYNHYNDPVMYNYPGVSSYSSTLIEQARVFQHDLGYFSPNVRRISTQGFTHLSDTLMGVKYRLNPTKHPVVNQLNSYAGIGFAVPNRLASLQLDDQNAMINQERVLTALGAAPNTLAPVTVLNVRTHRAVSRDLKHVSRTTELPNQRFVQTFTVQVNATGLLHGYSPANTIVYSSIKVNGKSLKPAINADGYRYLINLGHRTKGEVLKISYVTQGPLQGYGNQFATLNQQRYEKLVTSLKQQRFKLRNKSGVTWLDGDVTGTPQRSLLYLAVPDTPGWTAKVNGRPVAIRSVMHAQSLIPVRQNYKGMIGVPLKVGKNHVTLTYTTPGLKLGIIVSLTSFVIFAFLWFTAEWRRPLKHHEETVNRARHAESRKF